MWVTVLLQALFFAIGHAPEIIAALKALFAFFKEHKNNPNMSGWMTEFSGVMKSCQESHDPRPLQEFLEKLRASIKEK